MSFWERLKVLITTFGLGVEDAGVFCRTQWRLPWPLWVIYRVFLAIYYPVAILIFAIAVLITDPKAAATSLLFATDWTCMLVALYFLVAIVNLFLDRNHARAYHKPGAENVPSVDLSWRHKLQWLLLNIIMNFSVLVTIVYWSFLKMPLPIIFDLTCHTFPSILGVIEILLTPIPVKIQHAVYPLGYGFIYLMFTLIFYVSGGTNSLLKDPAIYPGILDWTEPGNTCIAMLIIVVAMIGCQIFLWALYKARVAVAKRFMAATATLHSRVASEPPRHDGISEQSETTGTGSSQGKQNGAENGNGAQNGMDREEV